MSDIWEESGERIKQVWIKVGRAAEFATLSIKRLFEAMNLEPFVAYRDYPNRKIVHLAQYGKTHRIRKKNHDKIMRWYREVKK